MRRTVKAWGMFKPLEDNDPVEVDMSRASIESTYTDWGGASEGYVIRPVEVTFYDDDGRPSRSGAKRTKGGRRG